MDRRAGRDPGRGPGCTGVPARADTPVGSRGDDRTLSSSRVSGRWRDGPDPAACWSPASGGLRAPYTSLLSSPGTMAVRAPRWPPLLGELRGRQRGGAVDPGQTPAGPGAVAPGTTACGTVCVRPGARGTRGPRVGQGAW